MSHTLSDYFALEAGEYLEQLDGLLSEGGVPDGERFFRLARGVRGSARVAQEAEIARVAGALEAGARALHEGTLPWSEEIRARAIRTVDDLKVLVRARGHWSQADTERAREAESRWSGLPLDREPAAGRPTGTAGDQLVAFLRREAMGVVTELDHVVDDLRRGPGERESLRGLVRAMRPLRGMAGVDALAPTQEVLEGTEDAAGELLSQERPLTDAHLELLGAARAALLATLRAVEHGAAGEPLPELERFREARDRVADAAAGLAGEEEGVLPISALFHADAGPHVVSSPLAPVPGEGGGAAAEVVRFLRLEATGFLDRAEALIAGISPRSEKRVAGQLARLAESVRELSGTYGMTAVAAAAERAAADLRASGTAEEARAALAHLRSALPGAMETPTSAAAQQVPEEEEGVVPIESLLLRGEAALREALALRPEVERLAGAGGASAPELREKLAELFDLVRLGMEAPTPT